MPLSKCCNLPRMQHQIGCPVLEKFSNDRKIRLGDKIFLSTTELQQLATARNWELAKLRQVESYFTHMDCHYAGIELNTVLRECAYLRHAINKRWKQKVTEYKAARLTPPA